MDSKKITIVTFALVIGFSLSSIADTLHLKNGRSIEGLIKWEDEESIELDVGFGIVKFDWNAIESVDRSSSRDVKRLRQDWKEYKKLQKKKDIQRKRKAEEARLKKELEPKEVGFSGESGHIAVDVLLNNKVNAKLILDTGASVVLLSRNIAQRLDSTKKGHKTEVQMADGRKVQARYITLDSVIVQGVEAKNVGAVVLSEEEESGTYDGLLGMSFLNNFNFSIDPTNKKLILQRIKNN